MNIKKLSQIVLAVVILAASSQFSFAQSKAKLVSQLIDLTILQFPSAQLRKPLQDSQEKVNGSLKVELTKSFTVAIDADEKFTAQQKAKMKEHLPELADDLSDRFTAKLLIAFSNNVMIKESLREAYQRLTTAELKRTVAFVKTPAGKSFVNFMSELAVSVFEKSNTEPQPPTKYEAQIERFGKTSAGEKFLSAFSGDAAKIFYEKANNLVENYLTTLNKSEFESVVTDFKNRYAK